MSEKLNTILERFKSKLSYRDQDKEALDISRAAASGNLNDKNMAEYAMISNDPIVTINYVRTFITVLASKLSQEPTRPQDDKLNELVINMRLNSRFTELYKSTLGDGYAFLGFGLDNGQPIANIIDARSIMYNGDDPTLKDATEVIVFEVLPREATDTYISDFPSGYVEFDTQVEKVRTYRYLKNKGRVTIETYEEGKDDGEPIEIPNVDRIPIVRFFGEKFELSDKRYHYRGLYYQMSSLIKAIAVAATKLSTDVASYDSDNYVVDASAVANHRTQWANTGSKEIDTQNAQMQDIKMPFIQLQKDRQFLLSALNAYKSAIADQLGPVVQSGSEAVTREEVLARNEVRDAIANIYLANIADSIAESYRILQALKFGVTTPVIVQGGLLAAAQTAKTLQQLITIYNLAKESGLNAQGFVLEIVANADLPLTIRQRLGKLLLMDPYASPLVVQLKQQLQQQQQIIQNQQNRITQLQIMASQRMERQAEWVASQERIKRAELMLKQWQQENKDTQEARMEVLRRMLDVGDTVGAMALVQAIQQVDTPVLETMDTQVQMADATQDTLGAYKTGVLSNVGTASSNDITSPAARPATPGPAPIPTGPGIHTGPNPTAAPGLV